MVCTDAGRVEIWGSKELAIAGSQEYGVKLPGNPDIQIQVIQVMQVMQGHLGYARSSRSSRVIQGHPGHVESSVYSLY